MLENSAKTDLELMVQKDERILWQGKPNKKCYILEGVFNPLFPFALIWLIFDLTFFMFFMGIFRVQEINSIELPFSTTPIICFFLLHLMPVWIYILGALFVLRRYKHTQYIVTDKGVYISGGIFAYTCHMKPFTEISHIKVHRGIFDQYLKVGDVVFSSTEEKTMTAIRVNGHPIITALSISDIPDYQKVFELVKKLQTDIFSDTMYPNDLRPEENHGYRTKYKGL